MGLQHSQCFTIWCHTWTGLTPGDNSQVDGKITVGRVSDSLGEARYPCLLTVDDLGHFCYSPKAFLKTLMKQWKLSKCLFFLYRKEKPSGSFPVFWYTKRPSEHRRNKNTCQEPSDTSFCRSFLGLLLWCGPHLLLRCWKQSLMTPSPLPSHLLKRSIIIQAFTKAGWWSIPFKAALTPCWLSLH